MTKKITLVILLISLALTFTACQNNNDQTNQNQNSENANINKNTEQNNNINNKNISNNLNMNTNQNNTDIEDNSNQNSNNGTEEKNLENNNSLNTFTKVLNESNLQNSYEYYLDNKNSFSDEERLSYFKALVNEVNERSEYYFILFDEIEDNYRNPYYGAVEIGEDVDNYKDIFHFDTQTLYTKTLSTDIKNAVAIIQNDNIFEIYKTYYMGPDYFDSPYFRASVSYNFNVFMHNEADELNYELPYFSQYISQILKEDDTSFDYDNRYGKYPKILVMSIDNLSLIPFQDKVEIMLPIEIKNENMPNEYLSNDYSEGYDLYLDESGNLCAKYNNTSNEEVLVPYEDGKIFDIQNINKSHYENYVLFEVPEHTAENHIYSYNMNSKTLSSISNGYIIDLLQDDTIVIKYSALEENSGRVIKYANYDFNGQLICKLGSYLNTDNIQEQIKSAKKRALFNNEMYNGEEIIHTNYNTVILPLYNGINENLLEEKTIQLSYENYTSLTFAVFGEITNVQIKYTPNGLNEEYQITKTEDLKNSLVTIITEMPTDFSNIIVDYYTVNKYGETVHGNFILLDMRDASAYSPLKY